LAAINGGNVVEKSADMPWYDGLTVLEHLEALKTADVYERDVFRSNCG
jgi:sulfate adenylyltransferase subunit 1